MLPHVGVIGQVTRGLRESIAVICKNILFFFLANRHHLLEGFHVISGLDRQSSHLLYHILRRTVGINETGGIEAIQSLEVPFLAVKPW
jgi:hypothetical protein